MVEAAGVGPPESVFYQHLALIRLARACQNRSNRQLQVQIRYTRSGRDPVRTRRVSQRVSIPDGDRFCGSTAAANRRELVPLRRTEGPGLRYRTPPRPNGEEADAGRHPPAANLEERTERYDEAVGMPYGFLTSASRSNNKPLEPFTSTHPLARAEPDQHSPSVQRVRWNAWVTLNAGARHILLVKEIRTCGIRL